jgi:hypothetical protein
MQFYPSSESHRMTLSRIIPLLCPPIIHINKIELNSSADEDQYIHTLFVSRTESNQGYLQSGIIDMTQGDFEHLETYKTSSKMYKNIDSIIKQGIGECKSKLKQTQPQIQSQTHTQNTKIQWDNMGDSFIKRLSPNNFIGDNKKNIVLVLDVLIKHVQNINAKLGEIINSQVINQTALLDCIDEIGKMVYLYQMLKIQRFQNL